MKFFNFKGLYQKRDKKCPHVEEIKKAATNMVLIALMKEEELC